MKKHAIREKHGKSMNIKLDKADQPASQLIT